MKCAPVTDCVSVGVQEGKAGGAADAPCDENPAREARTATAMQRQRNGATTCQSASRPESFSSFGLVESEVEQRHPECAGEEEQEDADQEPAEADVAPDEIGIHHRTTVSTASATKSSARYRS